MTVEKIHPSGGWLISDIVGTQLVKQRYFGYNKREAMQQFRDHVRQLKGK